MICGLFAIQLLIQNFENLTEIFAVLERFLLRPGTPPGTRSGRSIRSIISEIEGRGKNVAWCDQGGVPVLVESRIGLVCSKELSTGPPGLLSDR